MPAQPLSRRRALATLFAMPTLGAAASTATAETPNPTSTASPPASTGTPGACTLYAEQVEGPFYFDPDLVRIDITGGRAGFPIELRLRIIASGACTPLANARVDVWHADAEGQYSGYKRQGADGSVSTVGETFLRGTQMTDNDGQVTFKTVYPGWYPGRTPHIHLKVFLDDRTLVTGQAYFDDALSARVYKDHAPYNARAGADTTNAKDFIFNEANKAGGGIVFATETADNKMIASLLVAVDRTAESGGVKSFLKRWFGR